MSTNGSREASLEAIVTTYVRGNGVLDWCGSNGNIQEINSARLAE